MIIGIQDEILRINSLGLLDRLLADKTTKANILWATDAYSDMGSDYQRDKEIKAPLITGEHSGIIKNRARKALEQQFERTRQHAEVFTPLWVCAKMNDYADAVWFGRPEVFTKDGEPTERVDFPKGKSWQRYVDSRRLEITCGEAPYLVSRYDVSTGESIPIERRIGLLDRKLRVVNENAATEDEWLKWALRAFQSTYGYEFQGDNVLISRVNLLTTFEEYLTARWKRKPTKKEYAEITNIIAWNLWQMDGLTSALPYCKAEDEYRQMSIFDWLGMNENVDAANTQPRCRIMNWLGGRSVEFINLPIRGNHGMKFDFIIGNPPYQEETDIISETNGQLRRKSIFHHFQMGADKIATVGSVLIYPAGRWIQRSGRGMKDFGLEQINDKRLACIFYYPNAKDVFPTTDIADGISIVAKKRNKNTSGFKYIYCQNGLETEFTAPNPGEDIMPLDPRHNMIIEKIDNFARKYKLLPLHNRISPQKLFGIESDFVEKNPDKVKPLTPDMEIDFDKEIKLFSNDRAGKAGRAKWYVADKNCVMSAHEFAEKWKVVVSSANAGGQKRDNQLAIFDNHSVFGRARIALGIFDTLKEAQNFYLYMTTYLVRFAFLMTDENLGTLGMKVPDLQSYKLNQLVTFDGTLDKQLFELCSFTNDERDYIINVVENHRKKSRS